MKRLVLALLAALASSLSQAAPFLLADPYPSATAPDAASFTVNGGAPISCVLEAVTGGVRPKCDLVSISASGTYTLVLTVTKAGGIVNDPGGGGATNSAGGTASSGPFVYRVQAGGVAAPAGLRLNAQ